MMFRESIVSVLAITTLLVCSTLGCSTTKPQPFEPFQPFYFDDFDNPFYFARVYDMAVIPAGEFEMGSNHQVHANEHPIHTVFVDMFLMDIYEVTNAQYKIFIDHNPEWQKENIKAEYHDGHYLKFWDGNNYPKGEADYPVIYVSWYAAMAYAEWVGKRLPTEAEWEKAARGGLINNTYPWGNTIDATRANYAGHINNTTTVGQYQPNGYGLYDMAGNASEWCLDEYDKDFYGQSVRENPFSKGKHSEVINNFKDIKKKNRVLRGGSWNDSGEFISVTYRDWGPQEYTSIFRGFRCVHDATTYFGLTQKHLHQ